MASTNTRPSKGMVSNHRTSRTSHPKPVSSVKRLSEKTTPPSSTTTPSIPSTANASTDDKIAQLLEKVRKEVEKLNQKGPVQQEEARSDVDVLAEARRVREKVKGLVDRLNKAYKKLTAKPETTKAESEHSEDKTHSTVDPAIVSILIDAMKEQLGLIESVEDLINTKIRNRETLSEKDSSEVLTLFVSISATVDEALTLKYLK